jgi:hypothetical protein
MAQDWSVHAVVYFYSAGSDLPWAVSYWRLDMEFTDMTQEEVIQLMRKVIKESEYYTTWTVSTPHLVELVERAVEAEREACARLVDHILKEGGGTWGDAIRARGQA